jgi:hypothetical protein
VLKGIDKAAIAIHSGMALKLHEANNSHAECLSGFLKTP